jgi:hypothetical protein
MMEGDEKYPRESAGSKKMDGHAFLGPIEKNDE